jgi:hypothetical protein
MSALIGPVMVRLREYLAAHPGATPYDWMYARTYHGRPSSRYAYAVVHRALRAGIVRNGPRPPGVADHATYHLYAAEEVRA